MAYEWDDRELAHRTTKYSDWYKCILGKRDIIRVIEPCHEVFRHNWKVAGGMFRTSMCSLAEHKTCPMCERLDKNSSISEHTRVMTFATTIVHFFRGPIHSDEGQKKYIGRLLAWRFGEDKKNALVEINALTGKRLKEVDLSIRVQGELAENEKFQKLTITHISNGNVFESLPKSAKNNLKKLIKDGVDKIRHLYHPTPDELLKFIKLDEEAESFSPEEFSDLDDESGKKEGVKPDKKSKEDEEDVLSGDDELDELIK